MMIPTMIIDIKLGRNEEVNLVVRMVTPTCTMVIENNLVEI